MPYVFVISNIDDDEQDICLYHSSVFQKQSESNDVSFVHKRIIFV